MALITPSEVINDVLPNRNLDENLLEDSIVIAELKYIKKVLGKALYELLLAEVATPPFTGMNESLLEDHLKPALSRYVVYESMPFIKAEITSNGINIPNLDYSDPVTESSYAMLRNKLLSDAELLIAEMKDFLLENSASFPDYDCSDNISDKTLPFLY